MLAFLNRLILNIPHFVRLVEGLRQLFNDAQQAYVQRGFDGIVKDMGATKDTSQAEEAFKSAQSGQQSQSPQGQAPDQSAQASEGDVHTSTLSAPAPSKPIM